MLVWTKIERAAKEVPDKLSGYDKIILYLHRQANTTSKKPYDFREHRHKSIRERFDCTVEGFGIRPKRLREILTIVTLLPPSAQSKKLSRELWVMLGNSKRSFRQKNNTSS
jgi:hypothetical protein